MLVFGTALLLAQYWYISPNTCQEMSEDYVVECDEIINLLSNMLPLVLLKWHYLVIKMLIHLN